MVVVPAGSFRMGSPPGEEGRDDDEGPVHRVEIREPFAVGKHEVTFAEWDACVSSGGCGSYRPNDEGWGRGRRPVINVNWEDAKSYVSWLSRKSGEAYRLLSESEWEYAARAGTTGPFHFGSTISSDQANAMATTPMGRVARGFIANGRCWQAVFRRMASTCMTCMAMSGNGSRIAGMVTTRRRPTTAGPGPRAENAPAACCGAARGSTAVGCAFRESLRGLGREPRQRLRFPRRQDVGLSPGSSSLCPLWGSRGREPPGKISRAISADDWVAA